MSKKPYGKTPKVKPFSDVTFKSQHPAEDVADHEVLMAFNGDSDAYAFHDWWGEEGAVLFNTWLEKRREV